MSLSYHFLILSTRRNLIPKNSSPIKRRIPKGVKGVRMEITPRIIKITPKNFLIFFLILS